MIFKNNNNTRKSTTPKVNANTIFSTSKIVFLLVLLFVFVSSAYGFTGSGSGTEGDPYLVTDVGELAEMDNEDAFYLMTNDIVGGSFASLVLFNGDFDGGGYTIWNLTKPFIQSTNSGDTSIKNVIFDGTTISGIQTNLIEETSAVTNSFLNISNVKIINSNLANTGSVHSSFFIGVHSTGGSNAIIHMDRVSVTDSVLTGGIMNGGLIARTYNSDMITNSFLNNVTMPNVQANRGCMIGRVQAGTPYLRNSYCSANTIDTAIAKFDFDSLDAEGVYWDSDSDLTQEYSDALSTTNRDLEDVESLNKTQMQTQSSFTEFDFVNIWDIKDGVNNGYPFLQGQGFFDASIIVSDFEFYALNGSKDIIGNETFFSTANMQDIEYMRINFTVTSTSEIDDFRLYFTANGTGSCASGNIQNEVCLSYPSFIQYLPGNVTTYFDGTEQATTTGDLLECSYDGDNLTREYTCIIDEHYNPNVFKYYSASYNFSDVKYQTGVDQRIHKTNRIKFMAPGSPFYDADQYKLDFRVQPVGNPTQPLQAYVCNNTYVTGEVIGNDNCRFVASKLPSELGDDGSKFRAVITADLFEDIIFDEQNYSIVLLSNEPVITRYYAIKTLAYQNTNHTQKWTYSTDDGDVWQTNNDGYETEFNINWFYDGFTPTQILFKVGTSNIDLDLEVSDIYSMTWDIDPTRNYAPLVTIINPDDEDIFIDTTLESTPLNVSWNINEPNSDSTTTNVSINQDGTSWLLGSNILDNVSYLEVNLSFLDLGIYNITVESCETNTTELYCSSSTRTIILKEKDFELTDFYSTASEKTCPLSETNEESGFYTLMIISAFALVVFGFIFNKGIVVLFASITLVYLSILLMYCDGFIGLLGVLISLVLLVLSMSQLDFF